MILKCQDAKMDYKLDFYLCVVERNEEMLAEKAGRKFRHPDSLKG